MSVEQEIINQEADARNECHRDHPTHRPLSQDYEKVGLTGEATFAEEFGVALDLMRRPNGDGGTDHQITVLVERKVNVDIKTARKPTYLAVEVGKAQSDTIYVLAFYCDACGNAKLLGWQWGSVVLRAPTKDLGHGVLSHCIPRDDLRKMRELKRRLT
jgi:hypothetical protein